MRLDSFSTDATNVVPDEFKADMVTVIRDKVTGDPLLLVVVEPQGREDEAKKFAWPAYLANLRAAHKCESAVLIVICWKAAEAEKCRAAIPMGHPGYVLVPIVMGPGDGEDLNGTTPRLTVLAGSMGAIDLETEGAAHRARRHQGHPQQHPCGPDPDRNYPGRFQGIELTSEEEERIASCLDSKQLDRWLDNAGTATSASDVFKD
jgi:hypothetical protein